MVCTTITVIQATVTPNVSNLTATQGVPLGNVDLVWTQDIFGLIKITVAGVDVNTSAYSAGINQNTVTNIPVGVLTQICVVGMPTVV